MASEWSTTPIITCYFSTASNSFVYVVLLFGSSASTSETTQVGTYVARVRASDADAGTNAALTYKLVSGDERGRYCSEQCDTSPKENYKPFHSQVQQVNSHSL